VVRHYNNVIVANEENCYKIARDQTGRAAGNDERPRRGLEERATANGCRHVSCHFDGNAMDVSAILYDKISPQKAPG